MIQYGKLGGVYMGTLYYTHKIFKSKTILENVYFSKSIKEFFSVFVIHPEPTGGTTYNHYKVCVWVSGGKSHSKLLTPPSVD